MRSPIVNLITVNMDIGNSIVLTASPIPLESSFKALVPIWSVDNPSVVDIKPSKDGSTCTVTAKANGVAVITNSITMNEETFASNYGVQITVPIPPLVGLTILVGSVK